MNRNDTMFKAMRPLEPVDIVTVERQARAMQAQVMAEMFGAAWRWMAGRLRRSPSGQTA